MNNRRGGDFDIHELPDDAHGDYNGKVRDQIEQIFLEIDLKAALRPLLGQTIDEQFAGKAKKALNDAGLTEETMDPNDAWNSMLGCLMDGAIEEGKEYAQAVIDWLDSGGFLPTATQKLMTRNDVYAIATAILDIGTAPDPAEDR